MKRSPHAVSLERVNCYLEICLQYFFWFLDFSFLDELWFGRQLLWCLWMRCCEMREEFLLIMENRSFYLDLSVRRWHLKASVHKGPMLNFDIFYSEK